MGACGKVCDKESSPHLASNNKQILANELTAIPPEIIRKPMGKLQLIEISEIWRRSVIYVVIVYCKITIFEIFFHGLIKEFVKVRSNNLFRVF